MDQLFSQVKYEVAQLNLNDGILPYFKTAGKVLLGWMIISSLWHVSLLSEFIIRNLNH